MASATPELWASMQGKRVIGVYSDKGASGTNIHDFVMWGIAMEQNEDESPSENDLVEHFKSRDMFTEGILIDGETFFAQRVDADEATCISPVVWLVVDSDKARYKNGPGVCKLLGFSSKEAAASHRPLDGHNLTPPQKCTVDAEISLAGY